MKKLKKGEQQPSKDEAHSNRRFEGGEIWSTRTIFLAAFLFRVLLVFYSRIHDYFFEVSFTDVDYKVFSDAARHVHDGNSPFLRRTYRYTPLLAWLLLPNVVWPEFGKIMFCALDIVVGWMCYQLCVKTTGPSSGATSRETVAQRAKTCVLVFWLINPWTAIISARGNADVLVCAAVICTLYLLLKRNWLAASVVHGLFAVHLKIYPVVYLPSIFLYLSDLKVDLAPLDYCKRILLNKTGYIFAIISLTCFFGSVWLCYMLYGQLYLNEALLYHVTRTDIRHNFSPYFYILYLASEDISLSRLVGIGAFLPQAALILYFAFRYHKDLPFCWLLTTISFVAFNKVCTSQYFVWYICFLPVAQKNVQISAARASVLVALWALGQAFWLYPAYLFEFRGYNTFLWMWMASLVFLAINSLIIVQLCLHYNGRTAAARGGDQKKTQ